MPLSLNLFALTSTFSSSANLVVPEAIVEISETAVLTSLPQTSHVAPVKPGKPLVPSDTLTSARYVI